MATLAPLTFVQGETIRLYLEMTEGNVADVTGLPVARLSKAAETCTGDLAPDPAFAAIPFTLEAGASPPLLAGWWATIAPITSAALEPGLYLADCSLTVNGDVIASEDFRRIRIREAV